MWDADVGHAERRWADESQEGLIPEGRRYETWRLRRVADSQHRVNAPQCGLAMADGSRSLIDIERGASHESASAVYSADKRWPGGFRCSANGDGQRLGTFHESVHLPIRRSVRAASAARLFPPRCPPELNSIKPLFTTLKPMRRDAAKRTRDTVCTALARILASTFTDEGAK